MAFGEIVDQLSDHVVLPFRNERHDDVAGAFGVEADLREDRAADACVGAVAAALAPSWGETTLIVVSDHGMTTATDDPSIVLAGEPIDRVLTCGGAAYAVPVAGASMPSRAREQMSDRLPRLDVTQPAAIRVAARRE